MVPFIPIYRSEFSAKKKSCHIQTYFLPQIFIFTKIYIFNNYLLAAYSVLIMKVWGNRKYICWSLAQSTPNPCNFLSDKIIIFLLMRQLSMSSQMVPGLGLVTKTSKLGIQLQPPPPNLMRLCFYDEASINSPKYRVKRTFVRVNTRRCRRVTHLQRACSPSHIPVLHTSLIRMPLHPLAQLFLKSWKAWVMFPWVLWGTLAK